MKGKGLNNFCAAGGFQIVADAAPFDASAEGGDCEIYGVEEWDDGGEKRPGPGEGLELLFVGGQEIGDGDPTDGGFYGGEKHDQNDDERGAEPELADGHQLDDLRYAENYCGAIKEMREGSGRPNFWSVNAGDGDLAIGEVEKILRVGVVNSGN